MGEVAVRTLRVRWNQHAPHADRTRPHRHPFHQVLYYSRGRGTQQLGDRAWPIRAGSLCFLRAGVLHSFVGLGARPATCLALDLELDLDGRAPPDGDGGVLRNAFVAGEQAVLALPASFQRQVTAAMARIDRETSRRQTGYATAVQGMLLELLALFLRATPQTTASASRRGAPLRQSAVLRRTMAVADPPDDEALSLARAARQVGVSPNHLNRLLKQQTGATFRQLIIQRRIERAKALLALGDLNCTEVAMACGFSDSNYFARLFRGKVGLSPRQFRRRGAGAL